MFARTKTIDRYQTADTPELDIDTLGDRGAGGDGGGGDRPGGRLRGLMGELFDFDAIRGLFREGGFRMQFDAMHAVTGPYARRILEGLLGAPARTVMHGEPWRTSAATTRTQPGPRPTWCR